VAGRPVVGDIRVQEVRRRDARRTFTIVLPGCGLWDAGPLLYVPSVQIDADVRSGGLTLITKPGITVDLNDVSLRSGTVKDKTQWSPAAPAILHVQVSGRLAAATSRCAGRVHGAARSGSGCSAVPGPARPIS
jgi:hypothetical protein